MSILPARRIDSRSVADAIPSLARAAPATASAADCGSGLASVLLCVLVFAEYFDHIRFMDIAITKLIGLMLFTVFLFLPRLWGRPEPTFTFIGLFIALLTGSTIWYLDEIPGRESEAVHAVFVLAQSALLGYMTFCLCSRWSATNGITATLFLGALVVAAITAAGIGTTERHGRVSFFELDENALTMFLGLGVVAGYHLICTPRLFAIRLSVAICLPLILWCAMTTGSRGGTLALATGILVYNMASRRLLLMIGGAALIALLWQWSDSSSVVRERWERTIYEQDTAGRTEIFQEAVVQFLERPWFGRGSVNGYVDLGYRLRSPADVAYHNQVLWILNSAGIAGMILAAFAAARVKSAIASEHDEAVRQLKIGLLALVAVAAMSIELHHRKTVWVILGFAVSVTGSAAIAGREDRQPLAPEGTAI